MKARHTPNYRKITIFATVMTNIPIEVKRLAEHECCNRIRFIGVHNGKNVYSIGQVGEDGIPIPSGLPHLVIWDGAKTELVTGEEGLSLLSRLQEPA